MYLNVISIHSVFAVYNAELNDNGASMKKKSRSSNIFFYYAPDCTAHELKIIEYSQYIELLRQSHSTLFVVLCVEFVSICLIAHNPKKLFVSFDSLYAFLLAAFCHFSISAFMFN